METHVVDDLLRMTDVVDILRRMRRNAPLASRAAAIREGLS